MAIFKHAYCLSGSIGSGKSSLGLLLKMYGFSIIDADSIAHDVLKIKQDEVIASFGEDVRSSDGGIDRARLGAIVFKDSEAKDRLEQILMPDIRTRLKSECEAHSKKGVPYFVDIPLYFEKEQHYKDWFEAVIVIYAPRDTLLERVMARNSLSAEMANDRLNAQLDIEIKRKKADIVLDNSGSLAQLNSECERLISIIKEKYENIKV